MVAVLGVVAYWVGGLISLLLATIRIGMAGGFVFGVMLVVALAVALAAVAVLTFISGRAAGGHEPPLQERSSLELAFELGKRYLPAAIFRWIGM